MSPNGRVVIPLLGKGATNHLHRTEVSDALRAKGLRVCFLVRSDYVGILPRLPECEYLAYGVPAVAGWRKRFLEQSARFRFLYPSGEGWRAWRYRQLMSQTPSWRSRLYLWALHLLAFHQWTMRVAYRLEQWVYHRMDTSDLDALGAAAVVMLGVGTDSDGLGTRITWWAYRRAVPIVHVVGNYDNLSSKGYRGHPVRRLLVWGPRMADDAVRLQGVAPSRVQAIGPLRYNICLHARASDRAAFMKAVGFDGSVPTVAFCGSAYEFHYFEMLAVFKELKRRIGRCQLVVRVYPNQRFMNSAYMDALFDLCRQLPDVFLSIADPNYGRQGGRQDSEALFIEENELWDLLAHSDVVVNIFSTLTIEACLFDKPVINMWYFFPAARVFRDAVYQPQPIKSYVRRVLDSGATAMAQNREELVGAILGGLSDPGERRESRRRLAHAECGNIDGKAVDRLVSAVLDAMAEGRDGR
jgi:hypothetical protein